MFDELKKIRISVKNFDGLSVLEDESLLEERAPADYAQSALTVDQRKTTSPIVNMWLSSAYKTTQNGFNPVTKTLKRPNAVRRTEPAISGLVSSVSVAESFVTYMKTISPYLHVSDIEAALFELLSKNSDFIEPIRQLKYTLSTKQHSKFDFPSFTKHDWKLFIQVMSTFRKQFPIPVNFISSFNGTVNLQDARL